MKYLFRILYVIIIVLIVGFILYPIGAILISIFWNLKIPKIGELIPEDLKNLKWCEIKEFVIDGFEDNDDYLDSFL